MPFCDLIAYGGCNFLLNAMRCLVRSIQAYVKIIFLFIYFFIRSFVSICLETYTQNKLKGEECYISL